jgi:hypothetical protein
VVIPRNIVVWGAILACIFALEGGGLGRLVPFAGDGALAGAAGKEDGGENAPR